MIFLFPFSGIWTCSLEGAPPLLCTMASSQNLEFPYESTEVVSRQWQGRTRQRGRSQLLVCDFFRGNVRGHVEGFKLGQRIFRWIEFDGIYLHPESMVELSEMIRFFGGRCVWKMCAADGILSDFGGNSSGKLSLAVRCFDYYIETCKCGGLFGCCAECFGGSLAQGQVCILSPESVRSAATWLHDIYPTCTLLCDFIRENSQETWIQMGDGLEKRQFASSRTVRLDTHARWFKAGAISLHKLTV